MSLLLFPPSPDVSFKAGGSSGVVDSLLIDAHIVLGLCTVWSLFCYAVLSVISSFETIKAGVQ